VCGVQRAGGWRAVSDLVACVYVCVWVCVYMCVCLCVCVRVCVIQHVFESACAQARELVELARRGAVTSFLSCMTKDTSEMSTSLRASIVPASRR
jgi:hypothetical protein